MNRLNWKKLLEMRCPKCGCQLIYKVDSQLYECALYDEDPRGHFSCDFAISAGKIEIVKQKVSSRQYLSNLEMNTLRDHRDWNNMGTNLT